MPVISVECSVVDIANSSKSNVGSTGLQGSNSISLQDVINQISPINPALDFRILNIRTFCQWKMIYELIYNLISLSKER